MSKCLKPFLLNTPGIIDKALKPSLTLKGLDKVNNHAIITDCGTCYKCRRKLARQHAIQIAKEAKNGPKEERHFIGMTYRDCNLPYKNGKFSGQKLEKDKKAFIAKMRNKNRYYDENGKRKHKKSLYYLVFEMSPTMRPHFHLIICGLKLNDLIYHKTSEKSGLPLHVSKTFSKIGSGGYHEIGTLTIKSAAYCAGYVMKKCDKTYNYQLQKNEPSSRTIGKGASPGGGIDGAMNNIDKVKNDPKYRTKYGMRKIKESMTEEEGLKYVKHNTKSDKRSGYAKGLSAHNGALAYAYDKQIKRRDAI